MRDRAETRLQKVAPQAVRLMLAQLMIVSALALSTIVPGRAMAQPDDQVTEELSPEQKAFFEALKKLEWVKGPTTVKLKGNADLSLPEGYVYLDAKNTDKYLELTENLGDGSEVLVAPDNLSWTAYLGYLDEGYVKDDETIDADAILKQLTDGTEAANAERRKRGWGELHVVGWAVAPNYNQETKRLEWATTLDSNGGRGVNFFTKILGRRGHTSVQLVTGPDELAGAETSLNEVLDAFAYTAGDTYADFRPGDKVAEYGLAAMVLGGAAAVATKKGFWAAIVAFLVAAKKVVLVAVLGIAAWVKSLFKKKE